MSTFTRPSITPLLLPLLLYLLTRLSPLPTPSPSRQAASPTLTPLHHQLLSTTITSRLKTLANISSTPVTINRPYLSPASTLAQSQLLSWMREASLATRIDSAGNVIGDLRCSTKHRAHLLLGSHHDTVPSAGRFDGLLGVITAISVAHVLSTRICELPFDIRVVAFDDEEGNNPFGTTNLGARAYTGTFDPAKHIADIASFTRAYQALHPGTDPVQAIRQARAEPPLAYLELHLEQGPVLERRSRSVGVVDAIAGQTRMLLHFRGAAGHAGTVPMDMRRDALAAAAECVLTVESAPDGVVGTVGRVTAGPGVGNVIPGSASMSVDIRARDDEERKVFVGKVVTACRDAGGKRGVDVIVEKTHDVPAVGMSAWVRHALGDVQEVDGGVVTSGAGHDAQIVAGVADVGMLFVRCRGGVSHTPEEFVEDRDVFRGAKALLGAVWKLGEGVRTV